MSAEGASEAESFARDIRLIGEACAATLARLDETLAAQRRGVLALAAVAGVDVEALEAPGRAPVTPEPEGSAGAMGKAGAMGDAGASASSAVESASASASPAIARAALYQSAALSMSHALHNAVAAQQHLGVLAQAIVAQGAVKLLSR